MGLTVFPNGVESRIESTIWTEFIRLHQAYMTAELDQDSRRCFY